MKQELVTCRCRPFSPKKGDPSTVDWKKQALVAAKIKTNFGSMLLLHSVGLGLIQVDPPIFVHFQGAIKVEMPCVVWEAQLHPIQGESDKIHIVLKEQASRFRMEGILGFTKEEAGSPLGV